jgi:hypothetical protein
VRDRERDRRLPREAEEAPPEPEPAADVIALQRAFGNRAVSSLLARQPAPPASERAATMTAGLGEDIGVIPIDSYAWVSGGGPGAAGAAQEAMHREIAITFTPNPAAAAIQQAAVDGKSIKEAFISTTKVTISLTDVYLSGYQVHEGGSGEQLITVTLNFSGVEFKPVR